MAEASTATLATGEGAPSASFPQGFPAPFASTTPTTAALATTGSAAGGYASAVGTGLQLVGQIYSAVQASAMGEYNAGVSRANAVAQAYQLQTNALQQDRLAQIAAYDLTLSKDAALFREARLREQSARLQGQTEALIGASGLGFEGSPLAVLDANARNAEMAVLVSNYQASLEQRAIREEMSQYQYSATLARYGAGERLRLGEQQADLSDYETRNTVNANILGAAGNAATGYQRYETARTGGYGYGPGYGAASGGVK